MGKAKKRNTADPVSPQRLTDNPTHQDFVRSQYAGQYPFAQAIETISPISDLRRKKLGEVRALSRTSVGYAATQKITNAVIEMQWQIQPPAGLEDDEAAINVCRLLKRSLSNPNDESNGRWRHFAAGAIDDLICANTAYIERHQGASDRPFWLFNSDPARTRINPKWCPISDSDPKFFSIRNREATPIYSENMFSLQCNVNSYEVNPPAPMEIAHGMIKAWLGLGDFQNSTTAKSTQRWMLDIGAVTKMELQAFREYWETEVEKNKKFPFINGAGQVKAIKIGANDDGGLYLKYTDYLLRLIALAFGLSQRDFNITEHDNRSTATESANSTFTYAAKPIARTLFEAIQEEVIDYYAPGFELVVNYAEPRSEAQLISESREDYIAGIISLNEARALRGHRAEDVDRFNNASPVILS